MVLSLARMSAEIGKTLAGSCPGGAVTSFVIAQVLLTSSRHTEEERLHSQWGRWPGTSQLAHTPLDPHPHFYPPQPLKQAEHSTSRHKNAKH